MLINLTDDMYWQVGSNVHYNKILAIDDAKLSGSPLEFYFYDRIMQNFDWTTDYTSIYTWPEILKLRAEEIRAKWQTVRLWYTGGRDSYLALKAFVDNDIVLDEIIVIDYNYSNSEYRHIVDDLQKNQQSMPSVKKITTITYDLEMQKNYFKNNWERSNSNDMLLPIPTPSFIANNIYETNTCNITGAEKPRLYFAAGKAFSTMYDETVLNLIGIVNHEPFFISENVPIFQYQAWNLLRYVLTDAVLASTPYNVLNNELYQVTEDVVTNPNSLYYKGCIGALRTKFASDAVGNPYHKLALRSGVKIGNVKYSDLENNWKTNYPEIYRNFKHGILRVDDLYKEYFVNNNIKNRPSTISSKMFFMKNMPAKAQKSKRVAAIIN